MSFSLDESLNPEQVAAIECAENVFLSACPGSGKTRTLTYKIAAQLSALDSEKKTVVAITYTHRAADEIRDRVEQLGVPTQNLWIGTIHSFCLDWILRPYGMYHPRLKKGFRVIDSQESERMIEELCSQHSSPKPSIFDCVYFFSSETFIISCEDHLRGKVTKVLQDYWVSLQKYDAIDFELILKCAYELMRDHPSIGKLLNSVFSCILVDEYQDTREIQYKIIARIAQFGPRDGFAFIVGDPNQAIYNSLGGYAIDPSDLEEMSGLKFKRLALTKNYRSSKRVVQYFENFNLSKSNVTAEGALKDFPSIITYDKETTRDDLKDEIVRLIKYNIEELGTPPHEVCIIAPWWAHLASMTRQLVGALPDYTFSGPGMIPFARDQDNFWYKLSRLVLTSASPELYTRRSRWAYDVIASLELAGVNVDEISTRILLRACNSTSSEETDGLAHLNDCFSKIVAAIGVDPELYPMLSDHYNSFFDASEKRIARIKKEGAEAISEIGMFRKVFSERRGITVSTIHGAKGAEFDAVIAYGLLQNIVPHFSDPDPELSAKKLLYVIASRARKNLHLISECGRPRGRYNVYEPTKVLAAMNFEYN